MFTKQQRDYYNLQRDRVCQNLGITKAQYNRFRLLGNQLNQIYTRQCNGYNWSGLEPIDQSEADEAQKEDEDLEEITVNKIHHLCIQFGLTCYLQTDPRGATVYLSREIVPLTAVNYTDGSCIY